MSQHEGPPAFFASKRFTPVRLLGEGGMGLVWEARDNDRGFNVALKTLRARDLEALHRLKQEFRVATDLSHPNLIQLYDLFVDDATCFFTMELVEGETFIEYCRPDAPPRADTGHPFDDTSPERQPGTTPPLYNERRLRAVLPQLVEGVAALHRARCIHRDIKPSNVLVTEQGRVVLLDFGLAAGADAGDDSFRGRIVGTVDYMAPEQAGDDEAIGASDYYSVGVMLYEVLTGRVPFSGALVEILLNKQQHPAPPPRARVPDVPEDLDALCIRLLARDAVRRPNHRAIIAALGADLGMNSAASSSRSLLGQVAFTGRASELATLGACFDEVRAGMPSVVLVRGPSGIGKSALSAHFLEQLQVSHPTTVVLAGRCYERETVPYRAVDSLIDRLARRWMRMEEDAQEALLPDHAEVLPTLFPALGRVRAVANRARDHAVNDSMDLRSTAYTALREVLSRIAAERPLVVFLDDLQWADRDSVALLADLMRPPEPPPLLLLLASRSRGSVGAFMQTSNIGLLSAMTEVGLPSDVLMGTLGAGLREIDLQPLAPDDARALAGRLMRGGGAKLADRVAREAGGVPFFLGELAIHVQLAPETGTEGMSMEGVLQARIGQLSEAARNLLELAAVAGEPVSHRVAASALDAAPGDLARDIQFMRTAHLLGAPIADAAHRVECYHDRIRETVRAMLGDARRQQLHGALAFAYEQCSEGSSQQLAHHWYSAGDAERAARYALTAAREAGAMSDFDRASRLYRIALKVGTFPTTEQVALLRLLGKCLASSGHPEEAAATFREAADHANAAEKLELHHAAAEALLAGGHVEDGLTAIRDVLQQIGMSFASTPRAALRGVALQRTWLRVRGLRWKKRAEVDIPARKLIECDVCASVATALGVVDTVRAAEYQARHLSIALRLGEPRRVARAMALEAGFLAAQGKGARSRRLLERIETEFSDLDDGRHRELIAWSRGAGLYFSNNSWGAARDEFRRLCATLRRSGTRSGFELDTAHLYECFSLLYLGELSQLAQLVPAAISESDRRGAPYLGACLRLRMGRVWLASDEPDRAGSELDVARRRWNSGVDSYHVQHFFALVGQCEIALYRGDPETAWSHLDAEWDNLTGSLMFRVPIVRAEGDYLRGRVALALAAAGIDTKASLRTARRVAQSLAKSSLPVTSVFAAFIDAGVYALTLQQRQAQHSLERGAAAARTLNMALHVALAGHVLAQLPDASARPPETAGAAARWLSQQHIVRPSALANLLLPGIAPAL